MRRPGRLAACLALAAIAACSVVTPPEQRTWVAVHGPPDSEAPEALVLELGESAWDGYGGVVSVRTSAVLPVRLIGRDSCRVYAEFLAPPGTMWVIRFAANTAVRVEDWTGQDMEAGPALPERQPSLC